ncbi:MAG: histidine--tRNA ligase [bacterium]|nr:MAG: histidine--tRNA ligase [bacterium]
MKIDARNFKGTRDYLPNEMILRNQMIQKMRRSFEIFGFVPLETPALEYLDVLTGKYGEEGDKLIYRLNYKGGSVAGMKYDLTVPLARVITQHNDIILPFKRYQIQPVWRADRPQVRQGRFREFYQCDADIIGVESVLADADILALIHNILSQLEIGQFVIRINHRKILSGIREFLGIRQDKEIALCRGIDKLDKIGINGVKEELVKSGFADTIMDSLFQLLSLQGPYTEVLKELKNTLSNSKTGLQGIDELMKIFEYLETMNIPMEDLKIDLHLARGLEYYTGTIYESSSLDLPHIGSLTGGGRYDKLIGSFGGKDLAAVGTTIGLDRIATVLTQLGKIDDKNSVTQILVTILMKP